ncbi:pentapeptide repeat-containing protein [Tateyamaria sp. SN3-11]|uniref:pentapeptide repeat-containing protein n=1 Tax=Tateyamaria sp. SN3-11 TaxID=3092147 RepID=UPI0039E8671D
MTAALTFSDQLPEPLFWGLLALAGATVAGIVIHLIWSNFVSPNGKGIASHLGFPNLHNVAFVVAVLLWSGLTLLLTSSLFGLILSTLELSGNGKDDRFYVLRIGGLTAVVVAVIALPFTVIRLRLTQEQTETARESLFNDKINEATKGLYARRQVTKAVSPGGSYRLHQDFWQDDIVQRNAAIDRLEGLAQEKPTEVPRIARLLSVYVRELSAEVPSQDPPIDATPDELWDWAQSLPKLRSDMEKAAQTLGRLAVMAPAPLTNGEIDLRAANLQRADLIKATLEKAWLQGAQMQGADLGGAQIQGADLEGARMQGADLGGAQMQRANLKEARMQRANLKGARMQGANLKGARMQGADLSTARIQGADLDRAQFDSATLLTAAILRGTAVRRIDFTNKSQFNTHLDDIFGDATSTPPNRARPDDNHWPKHWVKLRLSDDNFNKAWRIWQATLPPGWDKID